MPKKIKKARQTFVKAKVRRVKKAKKAVKKTKRPAKRVTRQTFVKAKVRRVKKVTKKTAKRRVSLAKATVGGAKPIGMVTHFYDGLGVAIVKFSKAVAIGTPLKFKGATTDFEDKIISMQFDRKPITIARKNFEVGIKVKDKVREGDKVFEV